MKQMILYILIIPFFLACSALPNDKELSVIEPILVEDTIVVIEEPIIPEYKEFDRTEIRKNLQSKIDNGIPLVAHVLV